MTAAFGVSAAGFAVKPLANILADMQAAVWASPALGPDLDLSPQTPDGQMLGIIASQAAASWELLQICYNQFNRQDVEGAGADNLGDLTGTPREGESYTQIYATLTISTANAPYAAGSLVANIAGFPALTFSNVAPVTAAMISAGTAAGILFQSTVIGPTAAPAVGSLTTITIPVTGWTAVTNPGPVGYSQLGAAEEPDALYLPRQAAEVAAEGSCNPSATVAAIVALGAAQTPPVTLSATVYENLTPAAVTVGGVTLQPNQFAVFVYDNGTGWLTSVPNFVSNQQLVGQTIWNNRPTGNLAIGAITVTITDPVLGLQGVGFSIPTGMPLFVSATVVIRPGQTWANIMAAIQNALVAAAVAPALASGIPPTGQLTPGAAVIGSQLEAVIMSVPGVLDVQVLTFGFSASPVNTAPLVVPLNQVATILEGAVGVDVVLTQGTAP